MCSYSTKKFASETSGPYGPTCIHPRRTLLCFDDRFQDHSHQWKAACGIDDRQSRGCHAVGFLCSEAAGQQTNEPITITTNGSDGSGATSHWLLLLMDMVLRMRRRGRRVLSELAPLSAPHRTHERETPRHATKANVASLTSYCHDYAYSLLFCFFFFFGCVCCLLSCLVCF